MKDEEVKVQIVINRSRAFMGVVELKATVSDGEILTDNMLGQSLMDFAILLLEDKESDTAIN